MDCQKRCLGISTTFRIYQSIKKKNEFLTCFLFYNTYASFSLIAIISLKYVINRDVLGYFDENNNNNSITDNYIFYIKYYFILDSQF